MRKLPNFPNHQLGLAAVETALVTGIVVVLLFGVFEVGRAFFVANALEEATRRGARVAAVCQIGDPAIGEIAVFNSSGGGGTSAVVNGLTTANVVVQYVSIDGTVIGDTTANYTSIDSVRVSIQNFQHEWIIPFFMQTFTMPPFVTTVPIESLGVTREGIQSC